MLGATWDWPALISQGIAFLALIGIGAAVLVLLVVLGVLLWRSR